MFEAELRRKLPELRTHEDYLTSCIFGALKYLPPDKGLFLLLNSAFNYRQGINLASYLKDQNLELENFDNVRFHFWPRSSIYGEPDLVLILEGSVGIFLICMEIKYFSVKHGKNESDQLAKYYLALTTTEGRRSFKNETIRFFSGDLLALIYLTQFEAKREIEESLSFLETKGIQDAQDRFFHLRWQEVSKVIKPFLLEPDYTHKRIIYGDIDKLLEFRGLVPFRKFSLLPSSLSSDSLLKFPVFFKAEGWKVEKFTQFADLPEGLLSESLMLRPVFLDPSHKGRKGSFRGFSQTPGKLKLYHKTSIYYGG